MTLRLGTRGSPLALWQTEAAIAALRAHSPGMPCEMVVVRTEGDRNRVDSLVTIGGRGVFVREIEEQLLRGAFDAAVHSLKDVPGEIPAGLVLAAISARADARDALVSRNGAPLDGLPRGAVVGSSSQRRSAQLLALRPDLEIRSIRGNVDTRLRKLDAGEYDAIVLAAAGLIRLGLASRIHHWFSIAEMLPAAGQGSLAIECRAADTTTCDAVRAALDDAAARAAAEAERAFLRGLGAGCTLPVGAYAVTDGATLTLRGLIGQADGRHLVRGQCAGPLREAEALGLRLSRQLLADGGAALMEQALGRTTSA